MQELLAMAQPYLDLAEGESSALGGRCQVSPSIGLPGGPLLHLPGPAVPRNPLPGPRNRALGPLQLGQAQAPTQLQFAQGPLEPEFQEDWVRGWRGT